MADKSDEEISEHFSKMGKKSAEVNKKKGSSYYSQKARKRWDKHKKVIHR